MFSIRDELTSETSWPCQREELFLPLPFFFSRFCEEKMGDELANLLKIFKRVEKDGGQATLSVSTNAGKTTIKLELTSSLSKPAPSLPSSSASGGRRRRHRGPAKKEKAKVRAALHQATLASSTTSVAAAPSNPPPPARPLRIHPSPPPASGRRRVTTTARQNVATFSSLNVDGTAPPTPPPPPSPTPPSPAPLSPPAPSSPPTPSTPSPPPPTLRPSLLPRGDHLDWLRERMRAYEEEDRRSPYYDWSDWCLITVQ